MRKGNRKVVQNSYKQTHGSGARFGVDQRRKNGLIGGMGENNYWEEIRTDRFTGAAQDTVSVGVERTGLLGVWRKRFICEAMPLSAHSADMPSSARSEALPSSTQYILLNNI